MYMYAPCDICQYVINYVHKTFFAKMYSSLPYLYIWLYKIPQQPYNQHLKKHMECNNIAVKMLCHSKMSNSLIFNVLLKFRILPDICASTCLPYDLILLGIGL